MTARWIALLGILLVVLVLAAGCVQVGGKEPLVKIGDKGYGGGNVETQPAPGDSEQVAALKKRVADLEQQLAREKAKRESAEQERDYWKKRAGD